MRVLVCGCRDWTDRRVVFDALDDIAEVIANHPLTIVHGAATGADRLADEWAESRCVAADRHPADWKQHGRAAGMIRNREMADIGADLCIAFWDGKSPGTANMIAEATRHGIPVRIVPEGRK